MRGLICGPKVAACGMVLSAWGVIMLAMLGIFFSTHSAVLFEDVPVTEDDLKDPAQVEQGLQMDRLWSLHMNFPHLQQKQHIPATSRDVRDQCVGLRKGKGGGEDRSRSCLEQNRVSDESELDSSWSVPTSEASSVDSEASSVSASESTEEDEEPSSQSECMMMSRASCVLTDPPHRIYALYNKVGYNCFIAAGIYVLFGLFSCCQMKLNKRKEYLVH
ncbi:hypothetical protein JOQ06_022294 [Pogonophryne albipinna]|uniref:Uncharacterized protein n=1 Tax=Pogonophryne albipinna TaxID=1090488 RepID=A0AAD6F4Y7_9TELE|nr:hypothetical protein JOQ06_022294 [Pogonophryne albipinna]